MGATCAICELPVIPEQLEFELEFEMADAVGVKKLHVHRANQGGLVSRLGIEPRTP